MKILRFSAVLLAALILALPAEARTLRLLALGDSLTAGYGLPASAAFPVRLEAALRQRGHDVSVINAGVSGDTVAAGLARLDWALGDGADGVIVELGANDMLRGLPPAETRAGLDRLLSRIGERHLPVLLAGMLAAPNLGSSYADAYNAIFPDLARAHDALLYPFFLAGVAGTPALNQPDGLHPTAAGVDLIVAAILPSVEALIGRIASTD